MSLVITRRTWLAATMGGASISALAGCSGDSDDALVDEKELVTCNGIRFELSEGDRIAINWTIRERGPPANSLWDAAVYIRLETVADGVVEEWKLPYEEESETFHFTAGRDAEYALDCSRAGTSDVRIVVVEDG